MISQNFLIEYGVMDFDSVLNSIQNAIIAIDINRNVVIINHTAAAFFNVKEGDVIDKNLKSVLPESLLNNIEITNMTETPGKHRMGDRIIFANRAPLIVKNKLVGLLSVFQDITNSEAINAELDLVRKNEEFLESLIAGSYDGIYITDKNGKTLAVNQSYERISGMAKENLIGKYMNDLVRDGVLSVCVTDEVVAKKMPVTVTQTIKNGKKVAITGSPIYDENGNIANVITNVRDITELIKLQKQVEIYSERMNLYQKEIFKGIESEDIVCRSKKFETALNLASKVSKMDSTVMILGETGVGKEIIAQYIHKNSKRKSAPYIKLNCGAIPANLLESELFGYVAGAFTGANVKGKPGMFEIADGGTLFLDEIGEMPIELQSSLLRVLQDKEVVRVGDSKSRKVDLRIVAATNRNLEEMIGKGTFRQDLYFRLNVVSIHVPPLRERLDDIPGLAEKVMQRLNEKYNYNKVITSNFINALMCREWPGNVRELNNFIERQFVLSDDDILDSFLEKYQPDTVQSDTKATISINGIMSLADAKKEVESILIARAMRIGKSTHKAASILGMSQPTFYRKYVEYFPNGKFEGEE